MGGSGGGSARADAQQRSYNEGYSAFQSGQPVTATDTNHPLYSYYQYGYSAAQAEARAAQQRQQSEQMMHAMMANMARAQQEQAAQFQQQMRQAEVDRAAREEAARREAGIKQRDKLFSERLTNASLATDYITQQLNEEASTARLMGVDFNVTDEQKAGRISDYFATLWGEGSERELESLIKEWGAPEGFSGTWDIVRGNAKNFTDQTKPDTSTTIATGKGVPRLATLATLDDEEEALLG